MAETTRTTSESPARGAARERDSDASVEGTLAEAKNLGTDLVAAARDTAGGVIEEQRRRAADEIKSLGEALRQSAKSFEEASGLNIAHYADDAARQIGDFAETVRSRSWRDIGHDVEDFARRWPFAFIAAAVGIGFVGGRFLLSAQGGGGSTATSGMSGTAGKTTGSTTGSTMPSSTGSNPSSTGSNIGSGTARSSGASIAAISPGTAAPHTPPSSGFGGAGAGREKT